MGSAELTVSIIAFVVGCLIEAIIGAEKALVKAKIPLFSKKTGGFFVIL